MRIFALETDVEKIKQRFCHDGECVVLMTYYHGLSFLFSTLREIILSLFFIGLGITGWIFGWPMGLTVGILTLAWIVFVLFNVLKAYIDWAYDFILVTTDKIILIDQTSIFRQEIKPIHLENIGGVSVETQYWDVFPFGALKIHVKEGLGGEDLCLKYVPRSREVAAIISDVVTRYQRRGYTSKEWTNQGEQGEQEGQQSAAVAPPPSPGTTIVEPRPEEEAPPPPPV